MKRTDTWTSCLARPRSEVTRGEAEEWCVARTLPALAQSVRLPSELYFWPGRQSYTGQPTAEIHTLGSRPLLEAALAQFCQAGARLAEPGEFTLRAFLAGRLDLTQAEAVLGVIDAADPAELEVALAQLAGGLAARLDQLRDRLLDLLAHVEAGLDFADEDISFITPEELDRQLAAAALAVDTLACQIASRTHRPEGLRLVLMGAPNAGKSSLFNALVGRTGALVSDQPGTTRDYLVAELDFAGVPALLIDTAGTGAESDALPDEDTSPPSSPPFPSSPLPLLPSLRPSPVPPSLRHPVTPSSQTTPDRAAQAAAARQHHQAHVQIVCIDSTRSPDTHEAWLAQLETPFADSPHRQVIVLTKADLAPHAPAPPGAVRTSSRTGEGLGRLRAELQRFVLEAVGSDAQVVAGTAVRCRESLRLAAESLQRARQIAQEARGEELVATELRLALDELGKTVGAVYTDDVLDRIFSRFCVGK